MSEFIECDRFMGIHRIREGAKACVCKDIAVTVDIDKNQLAFYELHTIPKHKIPKERAIDKGDEVICTRIPANGDQTKHKSKMQVGKVYVCNEVYWGEEHMSKQKYLRAIEVEDDVGKLKRYSPRWFETVDPRITMGQDRLTPRSEHVAEHKEFLQELRSL